MPAKAMVRRTGHTPGQLRELARKHRFRDCRRRMRAIALAMEDGLSRPRWPPARASAPGRSATGSSVTAPTAGPSPTSGSGPRTASGWGARWRARASWCGGWASGTCPRGPSTRGRTPPPGGVTQQRSRTHRRIFDIGLNDHSCIYGHLKEHMVYRNALTGVCN